MAKPSLLAHAAFCPPFTILQRFHLSTSPSGHLSLPSRRPLVFSASSSTLPECDDHVGSFTVGDRVRVIESNVVLWHRPAFRKEGFNPRGLVGTVVRVRNEQRLTVTKPLVVKFNEPPFSAHFSSDELELVSTS